VDEVYSPMIHWIGFNTWWVPGSIQTGVMTPYRNSFSRLVSPWST